MRSQMMSYVKIEVILDTKDCRITECGLIDILKADKSMLTMLGTTGSMYIQTHVKEVADAE